MPNFKLSDVALRSLPVPERGTVDYWDTLLPSFGIRCSQGGTRTFILKIYNSRRSLGRYPIISLADARIEARKLLAEKTLGRSRPSTVSFPNAVKEFLAEKSERRRPRTVRDLKRHLDLLGFACSVTDVTHDDMARKLKRLPQSEFNHRLASAKAFFNWAQKKRYRGDNPTIGLSPFPRPSRSRVLSDTELQLIWRACEQTGDGAEGTPGAVSNLPLPRLPVHFATIVKLLILTGQRRGEIAALRAEYFLCSPEKKNSISQKMLGAPASLSASAGTSSAPCFNLCTLPPTLTKNGREHTFPIGKFAASLLSTCKQEAPFGLLFLARGTNDKCFNGWSKAKTQLDQLSGVGDWTLHDIRRTVATRMAELGVAPHIIERILNHVTGTMSPLARVYNRARYVAEMRAAIELWEACIGRLIEPVTNSNGKHVSFENAAVAA